MHDTRFRDIQQLAKACERGALDEVRELLSRNPDVLDSPDYDTRFTHPESSLWSPLGIAARYGHEAVVRYLLDAGANPVPYEFAGQYHHYTYNDWTREVMERGHTSLASELRDAVRARYGDDVDDAGNTPLHLAVAANKLADVRRLLKTTRNVDALNGGGRTPAVIALYGLHRWWRNEEKPKILDLLLKHGSRYSMLIAASRGDEARVRELLAAGESADAADPCWRRPLSAAVSSGQSAIVRLLLDHGANPNSKEAVCQGGYSLHEAARAGDYEMSALLLERGANPEHWVDSSGDCLFAALSHPRILHLMYSYGATMELMVYAAKYRIDVIAEVLKLDPSKANLVMPYGWDEDGTEEQATNIMRLAIRHGARFESASEWNLRWTALQYPNLYKLLCEHGAHASYSVLSVAGDMRRRYCGAAKQLGLIRFLVEECGGDVNYQNAEGITPLAAAAREGHLDIVDYLLSKGANAEPDGPDWAKPLALARHRGHAEVIERLTSARADSGQRS